METREELRKAEYEGLRNEQTSRVNFMYTHGISTFTVVLALISINIGVFVSANKLIENLIANSSMYYLFIVLMQSVLFFVPVCMVLPASNKAGENLRQIATLGAYFRIYYELPLFKENENNISWEILENTLNDANSKPKKFISFNFEYCILVLLSAVLYCLFSAYYIWRFVAAKHTVSLIVFIIVSIIWLAFIILIIIAVFKNVSVKTKVAKRTLNINKKLLIERGDRELIEKACRLNIIKEQEIIDLLKELNNK